MKKMNVKKVYDTVIDFVFFLSILSFIMAFVILVRDYNLEKRAIEKDASVVAVSTIGNSYQITIRYEVEGTIYENETTSKNEVTVNDLYKIKYDKDTPSHLLFNEHVLEISLLFSIGLVFFVLSLPVFMSRFIRKQKLMKWKKKGMFVEASILSIYVSTTDKKRGNKVPYKIRLQYNNPVNNEVYLFETPALYCDVERILSLKSIRSLPVYINKKNTFDYVVDTSSIEE